MEKRKRETSEFPSLEQITESRQAHRRHLSQSTQKVTLAKHQADAVQKVMSAFNIAPPITPSTRTIKGKGAGKGKKSSATQSKYVLSDTEDERQRQRALVRYCPSPGVRIVPHGLGQDAHDDGHH
jgi:hypothetical protein